MKSSSESMDEQHSHDYTCYNYVGVKRIQFNRITVLASYSVCVSFCASPHVVRPGPNWHTHAESSRNGLARGLHKKIFPCDPGRNFGV